ncbi:MAG: hypothetical protein M1135_00030 [Candidatus Omnitrophica bacterium]|nr:hypothetical protein [Candidatus Omnitrophota bacterium]
MKQKNNKMLLRILLYSIFIYLVALPLFSLRVKKPQGQYVSGNYTLVSFYGQKNKNITNLKEIAMSNQTIRTLSKEFNTKINKRNIRNNQKENKNIFLALNPEGSFITKNRITTMSSINNMFAKDYTVHNRAITSTKNKNTPVVQNIKSEILNILPQNIQTLYTGENQVGSSGIKSSKTYQYVSYINRKTGGIPLLRF